MSKTVTISDDLAALLEAHRKAAGYASLDVAAEVFIARGLSSNELDDDHAAGRSDAVLRALIDEAEASGPETTWNAAAVKAEALRRYAARAR